MVTSNRTGRALGAAVFAGAALFASDEVWALPPCGLEPQAPTCNTYTCNTANDEWVLTPLPAGTVVDDGGTNGVCNGAGEWIANESSPPPLPLLSTLGFYCSIVWPSTEGWDLLYSSGDNNNSNVCAAAANGIGTSTGGGTVMRTGMFSTTGPNVVVLTCEGGVNEQFGGTGAGPLSEAYDAAASLGAGGCVFTVSMNTTVPLSGPLGGSAAPVITTPQPGPTALATFNPSTVANGIIAAMNAQEPNGYQFAFYDDQANYLSSLSVGVGSMSNVDLPMETASMSKTVTAAAVMAAIEDAQARGLSMTLDSYIVPYLPSNWSLTGNIGVFSATNQITFRMVLNHAAGYDAAHDDYASIEQMVEGGPNITWQYVNHYSDANYGLLRILLAYLVDGPQAFLPFEPDTATNAEVTALSTRSYIRGKIFDPLGLTGVDDYYWGPIGDNNYYNANGDGAPCPPAGGSWTDSTLETPDQNMLDVGAGHWFASAKDFGKFISNLRLGNVVTPASFAEMTAVLPWQNGGYALGMGFENDDRGTTLNHDGGGACGAPQNNWIIYPNGYTAVVDTNTNIMSGPAPAEQSAASAPEMVCDVAVFRPSQSSLIIFNITDTTTDGARTLPSSGSFDSDGPNDLPVAGLWSSSPSASSSSLYGARLGVLDNSNPEGEGTWRLDVTGAGVADETEGPFGIPGDTPIAGDWDGSGTTKIGVFRPAGEYASWYLDFNGNGQFDGCSVDKCYSFGLATDQPVVGDWTGTGTAKIGVFRNGMWYMDSNGNGNWDGSPTDATVGPYGEAGDVPVAGDWTQAGGPVRIGVYRPSVTAFFLDVDGAFDFANHMSIYHFAQPGDVPVTGHFECTL